MAGRLVGPIGPHRSAAWRELQNELAQLSERSTQIVAEHAGHHVHHDDPFLVVEAIRALVERTRVAAGLPAGAGPVRVRPG